MRINSKFSNFKWPLWEEDGIMKVCNGRYTQVDFIKPETSLRGNCYKVVVDTSFTEFKMYAAEVLIYVIEKKKPKEPTRI